MELSIQTVLLNVTDLTRSIEFYEDVFGLRPISQQDEAAALMISEATRRQVLLLRELGEQAHHPGRWNIGLRMLSFEVGTPQELDAIERKLVDRGDLIRQWETETYGAIMGLDPDRTEVCVASSSTGTPITSEDWKAMDDSIYMFQ
jgi:catechol-2,3-dioxygenase